ncbi:uncharacterized protein TNCV_809721 [Trichonephila clavipes]|uniref:HTH CENPB-type domain-containing protein n=1 Tax=Trichonephila clavipes TaxID=2585209 RepID=A0A8X6VDF5_TRICX|nr:uncharacterized protein TNCV_809721 [Trichonephila clavipes]
MRQCRGQNIPMGSSLLKEKAKVFAKELGIEGWLTNFKKMNVFKKCAGALSDAKIVALDHNNTESDEDESEELHKLRNFFLQNHVDVDILQASFVEEKSIDKHKEKIFSASSSRVRKRLSKGNFPRLEQCLVSWMRHCRGQNIPMGGPLLKEKAEAFAKELGIEFSASEG